MCGRTKLRGSIEHRFEDLRRRAEPFLEIERFAESDGQLDALTVVERARIDRDQRLPRGGQVLGARSLTESFEQHAAEHDPRGVRERGHRHRFPRHALGGLKLACVVQASRLRQRVGSASGRRRAQQDHKSQSDRGHRAIVAQPATP